MRAYCFPSGHINFGNSIPAGAMVIARGPKQALQDYISVHARHGYQTRMVRGRRVRVEGGDFLLVPGVPEATNSLTALFRLEQWLKRIAINPPVGVRVLPR